MPQGMIYCSFKFGVRKCEIGWQYSTDMSEARLARMVEAPKLAIGDFRLTARCAAVPRCLEA